MADVVLIQPFSTNDDTRGPTLGVMENLGLGYLSASLQSRGISCEILDAEELQMPADQAASAALRLNPSVVGIAPVALTTRASLQIARRVKSSKPKTAIVFGGHHATLCSKGFLQNETAVDYVLRGDGERALPRLVEHLLGRSHGSDFGVSDRQNPESPIYQEPDLDSLPWPDRPSLKRSPRPTEARLLTSRGCYYRCSFCTTPSFSKGIRVRRLSDVIREIQSLSTVGIRHLWLNDDLFISNSKESHERARAFCHGLRKSSLSISFRPMARADSFDRDPSLVDELIAGGMSHIFVGIESGNDSDLRLYQKDVQLHKNVDTIRYLKRKSGLVFQMGFIMFNPTSTLQTLEENLAFLTAVGEDYRAFPFFRSLSVFPETPIAKRLEAVGLLGDVSYDSEDPCAYNYVQPLIGLLARLQKDYYPRVSVFDSAVYRGYSDLSKAGCISGAEDLQIQAALINRTFFRKLLSQIQKHRLSALHYAEIFDEYHQQYARLAAAI